ncbi:MAG: L-serine ammonia-lyase, iron-sulfur-dependent, subunit alpha [Erysipelotrichaceae bacterium]|nr:L-serine ammonia-lyase, iron-sulfur-dependent, subunit alpha [Erysipelotrichaceae bacterium]
MKPIKDIYRIGYGPSSSHTIGPQRAAAFFRKVTPDADHYRVTFGGSLALTGKGHRSDEIVQETLSPVPAEIVFDIRDPENRITLQAYRGEELLLEWHALSLGGGSIRIAEYDCGDEHDLYPEHGWQQLKEAFLASGLSLPEYLFQQESDLLAHLEESFQVMCSSIERGLQSEGLLNEELQYVRSAGKLMRCAENDRDRLCAYAYAVGEENAAGHIVSTAPTLGSAGVAAALLYHFHHDRGRSCKDIYEAMAVGAVFGNVIKENATIAGSVGGCQAEIGTACAMSAAMAAWLQGGSLEVTERAAEIAMEHHLGLTCDPVRGYVIIPCIERNAAAVLRALDAAELAAKLVKIGKKGLVSFDMVVASMNYTGQKIAVELKETSLGGLALEFDDEKKD